ncbi:MAG TPA: type III-B CRISPR module-associated Cmr3 family protein [Nitrospiraceae bacterium]|jgi:CRISPR-associated protein Cmr3|nr:type III-B CRISPR module-associated Cmr3 family protein [Nitrospiraceae bacterium]
MVATATRQTLFIEPLDVLILRGNKLFGDPGSFGESLVPPWPSVAAGAIRSALLAHKGVDLRAFASGQVQDPELGTPQQPGSFRVVNFRLARRFADGRVDSLCAPPADLVIRRKDGGVLECVRVQPRELPAGIQSSAVTKLHAVLPERERSKPEGGYWLTHEGWVAYLKGNDLDMNSHLVRSSDLWALDTRVGVGLDPAKRSAAEGKLFTVQAVAMRKQHHANGRDHDVGFLAEVEGATIPNELMLRFGGDGRAARASLLDSVPSEPDLTEPIVKARRCRLILTSPGIFPGGWLPTGATQNDTGEIRFALHGVLARLVCAAVPRCEVVSGWDLAKWQPKPAKRVAPTGSVYWLDELEATPAQLRNLVARGLWSDPPEDAAQRAEGFNRFTWGLWP